MIKKLINIFIVLITTTTFSQNMSTKEYFQKNVKELIRYLSENNRAIESFDVQLDTNNSFIYDLKDEIVILPGNLAPYENGLLIKDKKVLKEMIEKNNFPVETIDKTFYEVYKDEISNIPNKIQENLLFLEQSLDIKISNVDYDDAFFKIFNSIIYKKVKSSNKDKYVLAITVLLGEIIIINNGGYWDLEEQYGLYNPYFVPNVIHNSIKLPIMDTILNGLQEPKYFDLKLLYISLIDPNFNLSLNPDIDNFYPQNLKD